MKCSSRRNCKGQASHGDVPGLGLNEVQPPKELQAYKLSVLGDYVMPQ